MSESDSFIEEVTEEVRRDQMVRFFNRHRWTIIGILVLIVAGVAYNEYSQSRARTEAEATGDALIAAVRAETPEAQAEALAPLAAGEGEAARIAKIQLAAAQARAEETDAAAATLEEIANDASADPLYRNTARLKLVMLLGAEMDAGARMQAIETVIAAGGPLRPLAAEQKALALIDAGETEAALAEFTVLAQDIDATDALRQRAQQMVQVLGGDITDIVNEALGQ